jgi:hypothetical protein
MRFVTKDFLSPSPDESGSIICKIKTAQVKDFTPYMVREGGRIHASVRIADCSENIELDFYAEGEKSYNKRLEKLDFLIEKLQSMRSQYVEMWDSHQRDLKFYKQREGIKDEAL